MPADSSGSAVEAGFGVVEMGDNPMLLLIAGVFVVTFVAVCAVAFVVLAKRRTDGLATTGKFELQSRLPISKQTFERIADGTAAAMARPQVSDATRAQFNQLERVRGMFVSVYRVLFISVGLAGLTAGILLLRSHTSGNMHGLPGAIIVLLSLGALLKGIVPGPSVAPMELLDQVHLDQLKEKINVQVSTSEPVTVGVDNNPAMMDDELSRLLAEGKIARARQVASNRSRRGTTRRPSPSLVMLLLFLAVSVALAGGVIYGMSFLGLSVLERLQPILAPIAVRLAPSLLSPTGLMILGLLTLAIGLPCAPRFRRPARFRGGIIALALALGTFWPLQFLAARFEFPFPEWSVAFHLLSGFISICLLTGGLEAIRMASNTPEADSWEFLK
jgi:hypothetical protein